MSSTRRVARASARVRRSLAGSTLARRIVGRIRVLPLGRAEPLSRWGWERGLPIDRHYIEEFLLCHDNVVCGHVLEVKEDRYSSRLGATSVDIVDIDASNEAATIVGDLCDPATLPSGQFDAAIITQTLQFTIDPTRVVSNVLRSLRPGGTLLGTVPALSRVAGPGDRWRWTVEGARDAFGDLGEKAEIAGRGNLAACRAFLMGMAVEELPAAALRRDDPAFPLVVTLRLRRGTPL